MKNIKYILTSITLLFFITHAQSQTITDALRMSDINVLGSGRTMAVGGFSFGSLGGDQGGIYYNPASLATYYKSEFIITPYILSYRNISELNNTTYDRGRGEKFGALNLGAVFTSRNRSSRKWTTSNIAITYNHVTDFEDYNFFKGISTGSIVNRFQERAHGIYKDDLDDFEAGLAYISGAIYLLDDDLYYESDVLEGQSIEKSQSINSKGRINEFAISWAGTYDNKISVGASLAFPSYRFEESKAYIESSETSESQFRSLKFTETLETIGTGINLKIGAIATPTSFLRLGLSVQTPTYYSLDDQYSTSLGYYYYDNDSNIQGPNSSVSPIGKFSYVYISPWHAYGNMALLIARNELKGFLSLGVKYTALQSGSFDLTRDFNTTGNIELENDLNDQIDFQLKNNFSFSVGAEIAYDIFRLRGGVQLMSSPYHVDNNELTPGFSGGIGLRFEKTYIDLAYRFQREEYGYSPYQLIQSELQPLVQVENLNHSFMATVGFMFGDTY